MDFLAHSGCKIPAQICLRLVFEETNRLDQDALIVAHGAGGIECGRVITAFAAEMSRAVFKRNGRGKGSTATGTDRRLDRPNPGPAAIAEKGLVFLYQVLPADPAQGRENNMQETFYDGL